MSSTSYAHPYRPLPVRVANALGRPLERLRRRPMTVAGLTRAARRRTWAGADFGDEAYIEPLSVLVDSIEAEARLTPVGRLIIRERLIGALVTRARVEARIASNPAILHEPLEAPIVILGLQRTGTTALHRLMAADDRHRALLSWEALNPVPTSEGDESARIKKAVRAQRALHWLSPDFAAVHPTDALAPEEEVVLLDLGFASQVAEASLHVPTYARWLEEHDPIAGYRYLRRCLQVLSHRQRAQRWILKTPNHLEHVDTLLRVFPDARLVWTHRAPSECVPSFASMVAHLRGLFSDQVDPHEVGRHWLRKCARMVQRAGGVRAGLGAQTAVVDVDYRTLVADPVAALHGLYGELGLRWTSECESQIRSCAGRSRQHRFGRHAYDAADFGLDERTILGHFGDYCERYGV